MTKRVKDANQVNITINVNTDDDDEVTLEVTDPEATIEGETTDLLGSHQEPKPFPRATPYEDSQADPT